MSGPDLRDRIRGSILGTLVGDALGVPVEFLDRDQLDRQPVTTMRGGGTWNQLPGTWSDDGAMTLVTADVLATNGWDPQGMMQGFRRWLEGGLWTARGSVFDVGSTTYRAIDSFSITGDRTTCGVDDESANGNGSLMRCLPVSLWLVGGKAADRIGLAAEASALTHAHLRSRLCCAWHACWCAAIKGSSDVRTAAAMASAALSRDVTTGERSHLAKILDGSAMDQPRSRVSSDGYVVSTLEAAMWCLANQHGFEPAVLAAVNLGGDTDTTGAVVGGMAGWIHGAGAIPASWTAALPQQEGILALADRFADRCLEQWRSHGAD